jgi:hypothetical protein
MGLIICTISISAASNIFTTTSISSVAVTFHITLSVLGVSRPNDVSNCLNLGIKYFFSIISRRFWATCATLTAIVILWRRLLNAGSIVAVLSTIVAIGFSSVIISYPTTTLDLAIGQGHGLRCCPSLLYISTWGLQKVDRPTYESFRK